MVEQMKEKSFSINWIVLSGIILALIGFLIILGQGDSKNHKDLSTVKGKVSRPLSGIFKLEPGKIVYTGILITEEHILRNARVCFRQPKGNEFWFINGDGPNIRIDRRTWMIRLTSPGELQLKGGKENTTVRVRLT